MRVAVVEDEQVVARRLVRLATTILGARLERIDHLPSLPAAREFLESAPLDLLFLDLNLHGRDGFRLLAEAASRPFDTVIVSAHHDQALRAFEYGVLDFVPKPFDEGRLRRAIERALDRRGRDPEARERLRYLAVRKSREVVPVPLADLLYVRGAGDYAELHAWDGTVHLHSRTLTGLEAILPARFTRVHRSFIVNLEVVEALRAEEGSRYFLRLAGGQEVPVSRARVRDLRRRLGE